MRLVEKVRIGSKIKKSYDTPKPPFRRLLASTVISQETKDELKAAYNALNPVELKRKILNKLHINKQNVVRKEGPPPDLLSTFSMRQ